MRYADAPRAMPTLADYGRIPETAEKRLKTGKFAYRLRFLQTRNRATLSATLKIGRISHREDIVYHLYGDSRKRKERSLDITTTNSDGGSLAL